MEEFYSNVCTECSRLITQRYSTSFTMGIKTLSVELRQPIYSIYGFVRLADEIVDTFHRHDKASLLERFKLDTYEAIHNGISLNPVLQAFQQVVNEYKIDHKLIDAFLYSMEMDLHHCRYDDNLYEQYIYGSAEVVGLMCLQVFCNRNLELYERLETPAKALGAAFQKVNFLRDMRSDYAERGRVYFPGVNFDQFSNQVKAEIEQDIERDFNRAHEGIMALPPGAKWGVFLAYTYYRNLFNQIKIADANLLMQKRIRVPDPKKLYLLVASYFQLQLRIM